GPGLRGVEAADATAFAERLLAHLGLKRTELDQLQALPHARLTEALASMPVVEDGQPGLMPGPRGNAMRLSPVVDGAYLPAHPFARVPPPPAAGGPWLTATKKAGAALSPAGAPRRRRLEGGELLDRLAPMLGERRDEILAVYRRNRPNDTPWEL